MTSCMSYGMRGSSGTTWSSAASMPVRRIGGRDRRRIAQVVLRQVAQGSARAASSASASSTAARCATPLFVVCVVRAAEVLRVDFFVGHGLHDVRPGDEHVARVLDHDREVGHRRRVDRTAGAWAHDDRDLRHDAGREDVAQEDVGVPAERRDAFLDPRAARIVEPDDRRADLHRQVHDLADLLGVRLGQRAAEDREVLAEDEDEPAVDRAVAGDDAVAEDVVLVQPESVARCVTNASSSTNDPGSSSRSSRSRAVSLPQRMLPFDPDGAAAEQRLGPHLLEPIESFFVRRHGGATSLVSLRKDRSIIAAHHRPDDAGGRIGLRRPIRSTALGYPQIR